MTNHAEILKDMLRGYPEEELNDKFREALLAVLKTFSLKQLEAMKKAGVRFWPWSTNPLVDELPPEFNKLSEKIEIPTLRTPARYMPEVRVIQLGHKLNTAQIRHELAHAWDHVRTIKKPQRLDDLNTAERLKAVKAKHEFWSESHKVPQMWQAYKKRLGKLFRVKAFDLGAPAGYSMKSAQEFYAEGYSVFHSNQQINQALLLTYAAELYDLLEKEAIEQGLPTPNRAILAKIK